MTSKFLVFSCLFFFSCNKWHLELIWRFVYCVYISVTHFFKRTRFLPSWTILVKASLHLHSSELSLKKRAILSVSMLKSLKTWQENISQISSNNKKMNGALKIMLIQGNDTNNNSIYYANNNYVGQHPLPGFSY